jgi:hypothetical protein
VDFSSPFFLPDDLPIRLLTSAATGGGWLRYQIPHKRLAAVAVQIIAAFAEGEGVRLAGAGAGDAQREGLVLERVATDVRRWIRVNEESAS